MSWHTNKVGHEMFMIQDGDRVVGSIVLKSATSDKVSAWCVEIIWGGPGGDLNGEFSDYLQGLAFVEGVEKAFNAFRIGRRPPA